MRKAIIFLLLCLPVVVQGQSHSASATEAVLTDLGAFNGMSPRLEGSDNERRALAHIEQALRSWGVDFQSTDFQTLTNGHSFSYGLEATISAPGQTDTLLLAASLDQSDTGTELSDGNLNLALLLALAHRYSQSPPPINLRFLFLGAEKGQGPDYPMGSRQFVANYYSSGRTALLYLDFAFLPKRIQIHTESGGQVCPIWLIRGVSEGLQAADLNFLIHGNHPDIFRFNLPQSQNLLNVWLQNNLPGVLLSSGTDEGRESNLGKWIPSFLAFVDDLLKGYAGGLPATWDRHYLLFQIQSNFIILSQGNYIAVLLVVAGLFLALAVIWPRRLRDHLADIWKGLWQLPLIFILLFCFLWVGTQLENLILAERAFDSLWTFVPLLFFSLKVLLAIFAYFVTFYLTRRMPFSRWSGFYGYSAVLVLTVAVFVSLYLELSFSFYFLWALIFAFIFLVVRPKFLKFACLILAPFWFLKAAVEVFFIQPDVALSQAALLSSMGGNLIITLLLFPFFLMISSFHFISHQRPERNERLYAIILAMVWGSASLALILGISLFNPFSETHPAPLAVQEIVDQTRKTRAVTWSSPIPTRAMLLQLNGTPIAIGDSGREQSLDLPFQDGLLTSRVSGRPFLDRILWTVELDPTGAPEHLDLNLSSAEDLVIYECNYPTAIAKEGNRARVFIGKFPPQHLVLQLTLSRVETVNLTIDYRYSHSPNPYQLASRFFETTPSLNLRQEFELSEKTLRTDS